VSPFLDENSLHVDALFEEYWCTISMGQTALKNFCTWGFWYSDMSDVLPGQCYYLFWKHLSKHKAFKTTSNFQARSVNPILKACLGVVILSSYSSLIMYKHIINVIKEKKNLAFLGFRFFLFVFFFKATRTNRYYIVTHYYQVSYQTIKL